MRYASLGSPGQSLVESQTQPSQGTLDDDSQGLADLQVVPSVSAQSSPTKVRTLRTQSSPTKVSVAHVSPDHSQPLALRVLRDMKYMDMKRVEAKRIADVKANPIKQGAIADVPTSAKPNAEASSSAMVMAESKASSKGDGAKSASAEANAGVKRKLATLQSEPSRKTWRVRHPDGKSKGFKYASASESAAAKEKAIAYMNEVNGS